MSVRRWILLQLILQTIPECFVHYLFHSALQTVQGEHKELLLLEWEKTHSKDGCLINLLPPLRKFCRFDLKSMVHQYFMCQSHVGDSFSCLHQFLHRDKPGRAGCEGRKCKIQMIHSHKINHRSIHYTNRYQPESWEENKNKHKLFHCQQTAFELTCESRHTKYYPQEILLSVFPQSTLFSTPAQMQTFYSCPWRIII